MLNISNQKINRDEILKDQSSYQEVMRSYAGKWILYLVSTLFFIGLVMMFLPWTQNIRARGTLTTLNPEDREQNIHTILPGRVEQWYVNEGDLVSKGDTIVHISEVKSEYLDPELIDKAGKQADAKRASAETYTEKASALYDQLVVLEQTRKLKLEQAKNYLQQASLKVTSDSIDFETALINLDIAQKQFDRQQKLYDQGLKSLTELEQRKQKLQESVNKKISAENKWLASKNEFINARLNVTTVDTEYREKIAKVRSDRLSALSSALEAEGQFNKLSIDQSNYKVRAGFYYITAPQDGFITKTNYTGIGETVKEGDPILSFIPSDYEMAVELYVRPLDLPLIREGNKVRLQFDGWPALVFSGWPGLTFGTFGGQIQAFDKAASPNGKFRILITPDPEDEPWPDLIRLGSGAYGIALLKNVPVWYELWRNLNGFPPDFYVNEPVIAEDKK
jgi:multidrug resistance efflux pump